MKCDILFIDAACMKPYNWDSLENDSLGGTEYSTIRLAEGFASKGHSVVVLQKFDRIAEQSPNGVHYVSPAWLSVLKPKNVIYLRAKGYFEKFPDAKQFVWFHDASSPDHNNYGGYVADMLKYNVLGIAVSDWHIGNIRTTAPEIPLKRIYSPVDELCYNHPRPTLIDKNQLVWMSSPHKGLDKALNIFKELQEQCPELKLIIFNPGYWFETQKQYKNVRYLPECSKQNMRSIVAHSLCLFYPTQFEETFGLVAAEANALGVPIATYGVAALAESCGNEFAKGPEDLKAQVLKWRDSRPLVSGQDRFRFDQVYPEWLKVLR